MDLMDFSNDSPSNGIGSINDINLDNDHSTKHDNDTEIEQPNPSIATPAFPDEMPPRYGK